MEGCLKLPPPPRVRVKFRQPLGGDTLGVGSPPPNKHEKASIEMMVECNQRTAS